MIFFLESYYNSDIGFVNILYLGGELFLAFLYTFLYSILFIHLKQITYFISVNHFNFSMQYKR